MLSNLFASQFGSVLLGESFPDGSRVDDSGDTYEAAYNGACVAAALEDYERADELLNVAAERLETVASSDGMSATEKKGELSVLSAQRAFILQQKGRHSEAKEIYEKCLNDSGKRFKNVTSTEIDAKLLLPQKRSIAFNRALLLGYLKKLPAARAYAAKAAQDYSVDDGTSVLVMAALTSLEKRGLDAVISQLKDGCASNPNSETVHIALSQLYSQKGDLDSSIQALSSFIQNTSSPTPGVVWRLVALFKSTGQYDNAVSLLDKASSLWRKDSKYSSDKDLFRRIGDEKLALHRPQEAAKEYERLVRSDKSDQTSLAGLVLACSEFDLVQAERYRSNLEPVSSLLLGQNISVDVDALESNPLAFAPALAKSAGATAGAVKKSDTSGRVQKKRKRKAKPQPKYYDPNVKPFAERWIAKRDRATQKRRPGGQGGRAGKDALRGPQGATAGAGPGGLGGTGSARIAGLSSSAAAALVAASAAATPAAEAAAVPVTEKSGAGSHGKKKKGRK
ncbi:hypothetical protein HK405_011158 [Cladochytrium tenue]|nr:hypothetical protein HK405_011158 [Cladochytrium tenue]